jgi:plasmid stabilization system protein ParE
MGARRRRVIWTETAVHSLHSCIAFTARESVDNAHRLLERVLGAADSLAFFGERGAPVAEYGEPDVRQLLVNPFRLLYRASESDVFILGILHQRQDVARWRDRDVDP